MTGTLTKPSSTDEPEDTPPSGRRRRAAGVLAATVGWVRRAAEPLWVAFGSVVVAVLMTWPALKDPSERIPRDTFDPLLVSWQIGWIGHALKTDPTALWDTNALYPETNTLAFTDTFLGYAPFGLFGEGPDAAVIRYNLLYVFVAALASAGAYALARALGARVPGALVAGAAFGYAPWRLEQAGHLHILSTGGMALALALLALGHGWSLRYGYRPEKVRPWLAGLGWAVASWQVTIGFGIGLAFAYVVGVVCVAAAIGWLVAKRPALPSRLKVADLCGLVAFGLTGALMARPYLEVVERHPYARRTEEAVDFYSPPLSGLFTGPETSVVWGERHAAAREAFPTPAEQVLLPGMLLIVLAAIGLFVSSWRLRQRIALAVASVAFAFFALGTHAWGDGEWGYLLLYRHLPGWDGLRTPGRLVIWTTLGLALLAAGLVSAVAERADTLRGWIAGRGGSLGLRLGLVVALAVPAALVTLEGLSALEHPPVPKPPPALSTEQPPDPILVLPSTNPFDQSVMLWSTEGYPQIANGGSGFDPQSLVDIRRASEKFPNAESVAYLRGVGIRSVVLVPAFTQGTPWVNVANADTTGLPLTRRVVGDAIVFELE